MSALVATLALLAAGGDDAGKPVSWFKDVRPILQEHCAGCHQPAKASGKVVLASFAGVMQGGKDGAPILVAGKPDESEILDVLAAKDDKPPKMPKGQAPLSKSEFERIRRWIAEGAVDDTPAAARDTFNPSQPPIYRQPPVVSAVDYSPDGSLLAISGYHEVLLYDRDGAQIVARLVGMSERIQSIRFSPDGASLLVVGGSPARMGEVQIWDVAKRELRLSVPVTFDTLYGGSWSPDGRLVAFGCSDHTVRALDASTGAQVLYQGTHEDFVLGTVFSIDGSHLVSVSRDRSMKLIEVKTQQFIDNVTSITPGALKGGLQAVDRHPKADVLLVGGADGVPKTYQMYRTKDRKIGDDYNLLRAYEPVAGRIFAAQWSRDGTRIAVGSSADRKGEVRAYAADDVVALAAAKAAETGKTAEPPKPLDAKKTMDEKATPKEAKALWSFPIDSAVYAVTFRPDGAVIAAGAFDGEVLLLDATSGALIRRFLAAPITP